MRRAVGAITLSWPMASFIAALLLLCATTSRALAVQTVELGAHTRTIRRTAAPLMAWRDPNWHWGSSEGTSHKEVLRLRDSLSTPEDRQKFLWDVGMMDPLDWEDSKIVLALKCQRVTENPKDYSLEDNEREAWRTLMDEIVDCQYEGYEGDLRLAEAVVERLGVVESLRMQQIS